VSFIIQDGFLSKLSILLMYRTRIEMLRSDLQNLDTLESAHCSVMHERFSGQEGFLAMRARVLVGGVAAGVRLHLAQVLEGHLALVALDRVLAVVQLQDGRGAQRRLANLAAHRLKGQ
jgi:hypothetical protein